MEEPPTPRLGEPAGARPAGVVGAAGGDALGQAPRLPIPSAALDVLPATLEGVGRTRPTALPSEVLVTPTPLGEGPA